MKKLVRASLLMLALSCTAYAGDMPYPTPAGVMPTPVAQPQPTPAQVSTQESTAGDAQDLSIVASTATEAVLNLISGVLALL